MTTTRQASARRSLPAAVAFLVALGASCGGWCHGHEPGSNQPCRESSDDCSSCRRIPCECVPRKTLLQWSYGTSFEGGPPGFDEPLATDRPDFTEASVTVGRGVAQLETGYTYVYDREGGDRLKAHSFPEALLRVGVLAEWLEFRIAYNYAEETERRGGVSTAAQGSKDLYLGLKFALTPQEGILPEMALLPQMTVPSGAGVFSAGETLPGVNWVYGWDVNDFMSTAGSTQFNRRLDEVSSEPYLEYAQTWTVGYSLAERLGAYTEWFALVPDGADTAETEHYFDGGFTLLINNSLQLDGRGGVGLNDAAKDYFAGFGASVRF